MVSSELGACEWFVWDLRRSGLIERGFEPSDERIDRSRIGPRHSGRGHHAATKFPHGSFPNRRVVRYV